MNDIQLTLLHRDLWVSSIFLLVTAAFAIPFQSINILLYGVILSSAYWITRTFVRNGIAFPGGIPNIITLSRFLLLLICTFLHDQFTLFQLGIAYTLVCVGDFFDGFFARKWNQSSTLGEYLDKETDAVFVLILTCMIYIEIHQSNWVLIAGLIRYVYFTAIYFFMDENKKEPKDPWARIIAVFLFITLLGQFTLPQNISKPVLLMATASILYSFGRSLSYQLKMITKR